MAENELHSQKPHRFPTPGKRRAWVDLKQAGQIPNKRLFLPQLLPSSASPIGAAEIQIHMTNNRLSFLAGLLPEAAVLLDAPQVLSILHKRLGEATTSACLDPDHSAASPVGHLDTTDWLKRVNMVGVNVRTVRHFWNVVKYALTLPQSQSSVHLLPIWEPGVVSSLYGIASWNINPEFFSDELYTAFPHLDTVERQLKVTVNLLHAMGKSVGMDVIPHTDRYSEIVLANPQFFEWLRREGTLIIDHADQLHEKVQDAILLFLAENGSAGPAFPASRIDFFGDSFGEANRVLVLFGTLRDYGGRGTRRSALMDFLFRQGFEPVPATMAPPYRGLQVDENTLTVDGQGRQWADYSITEPQPMSRVFGPLTRFKFYANKNDNSHWEIDFDKPLPQVWSYFAEQYALIANTYHFDFMRGDMAHVQMRPDGVPASPGDFYDPLGTVKLRVQRDWPHFGYFAETFLAPAGTIAFGDEVDHLETAHADTTLGDLQSMVTGSPDFLQSFRWYLDLLATRRVTPNFTLMTGDKDDPRFDEFYLYGNEARFFTALFLPDMPSYMGLGFECRDPHPLPAPNEHYTKLYVFKIDDGPKATKGPYLWGKNQALFERLTKIRLFAEGFLPSMAHCTTRWLLPPDPTGHRKFIAWTLHELPARLFVVNLAGDQALFNLKLPCPLGWPEQPGGPGLLFSTLGTGQHQLFFNGMHLQLDQLGPGEGRVYEWELPG